MKQSFIKQKGSSRLTLFFAGWGMGEGLLAPLPEDTDDVMLCFDYRDLQFDAAPLAAYASIRVVAWSMGVWVAGRVLPSLALPWEHALAFNGTPWPVDDLRGIPESIFKGTLDNLSEQTLSKFRRRMCGSAPALKDFLQHAPDRSWETLRDELAALYEAITRTGPATDWHWDKAFIGTEDHIFPSANQLRAWENLTTQTVHAAHYDADCIQQLAEGKETLWINH